MIGICTRNNGITFRLITAGFLALAVLAAGCKEGTVVKPALAPSERPSASTPAAAPINFNAWTLKPLRHQLVAGEVVAPDPRVRVDEIPFVVLRAPGIPAATVAFDPVSRTTQLRTVNGPVLSFPNPGIPISLQQVGRDRYVIAFRAIPKNSLWMVEWDLKSGKTASQKVEREGVDYLIFRGALAHADALYWVVYDNRVGKNFLMRFEQSGRSWRRAGHEVELPTLEDPAGTHYEMEPPLFLFAENDNAIRILGGSLDATIEAQKLTERRTKDCEKVLEAISTPVGIAVLCRRKTVDGKGPYILHQPNNGASSPIAQSAGIPWHLTWNDKEKRAVVQLARDARSYAEVFEYDLEHGQNSGMLDFGSDNIEGRVAWSQIYYLNGLLDIVHMARRDDKAYEVFLPMLRKVRLRLELEIRLLDRLLLDPIGMRTRAFTHDRSLALFAVQTSRALLLLTRYHKEFPDSPRLASVDRLRTQVTNLEGHIEVLADSGESTKWLTAGARHLRWPRGSAFYFDGLAVPYNHQNEWAYSIFEAARSHGVASREPALEPQREMVRHFLRHLAPNGKFPGLAAWHYWWGHAFDGYDSSSQRSLSTPSYPGDKSLAWISFRTIDLMAVLSGLDFLPEVDATSMRTSAMQLVRDGDVYPFAARSLLDVSLKPSLNELAGLKYARAGSPWEISNSPWALAMLPAHAEAEDQHSMHLTDKAAARLPDLDQAVLGSPSSGRALLDYLRIALPHNSGQALKYAGGELGGKFLAWNLAYDLRATLLGYEHSGDAAFLDLFEAAANRVMSMRDDRIGMMDDLRKRPAKAWGSNRYSLHKAQWVAWDAFAGMVAYPLARYCTLVEKIRPAAGRQQQCSHYRQAAADALHEYDDYWREDAASGGGYYFDPYLNDVAPLNHMNTLGLVHLELLHAAAGAKHRVRAVKLATYFKHHWKTKDNGSAEWEYWAGAQQGKNQSRSPEDVTHAQINVHFAYECYKANVVFDRHDMKRLAATFGANIVRGSGDWAADIGGGGDLVRLGLHEGVSGWIVFEEFEPGIRQKINDFVAARPEAFPLGQFSYATGPIAVGHAMRRVSK